MRDPSFTLTLPVRFGATVHAACEDACRLARVLGVEVVFEFNTHRLWATEESRPEDVAARYFRMLNRGKAT